MLNYYINKIRRRNLSRFKSKKTKKESKTSVLIFSLLLMITLFVVITTLNQEDEYVAYINEHNHCPTGNDIGLINNKKDILIDYSDPLTKEEIYYVLNTIKLSTDNLQQYDRLTISALIYDKNNLNKTRDIISDFCNPLNKDKLQKEIGRRLALNQQGCQAYIKSDYQWAPTVGQVMKKRIINYCLTLDKFNTKFIKLKNAVEDLHKVNKGQTRSYIIEAIEDILHSNTSVGNSSKTKTLVIISDMLQNSHWYSQYKIKYPNWSGEDLLRRRDELGDVPVITNINNAGFDQINICLVPRIKILKNYAQINQHKKMWSVYLNRYIKSKAINNTEINSSNLYNRTIQEYEYTNCPTQ